MKKLFSLLLILCFLLTFLSGCSSAPETVPEFSDIQYIFVHGLSGWGSYDQTYRYMPYWGMFGGDLIKYLRSEGYDCYAASVAPEGSAWDRACELYAQLSGTVVDYGKEHSERCGHDRFGRDFSAEPLVADWNDGKKIVLLGHSFGGATIRLFSELLANGSEEERQTTDENDLSAFFAGGQGSRIHALVTLAAPTNGTTAYDMHTDPTFDADSITVNTWDEWMSKIFRSRKSAEPDGRSSEDYASYDMYIDHALALNERISTLPTAYYFAFPCSATEVAENGYPEPIRKQMEGMFRKSSTQMGHYSGTTAGGFVIDASWQQNDGLVNTISAGAPFGAPSQTYDASDIHPGIWNVMPVFQGDHMSLQGGMTKRVNVRPFYAELLSMLDSLPVQ